jgi:hypothetical protein
MHNNDIIVSALKNYFTASLRLRELGITINSKDFTSQLGEWIIEYYFNGKRASSGNQKDWDIKINDKKVQVKTHAKSASTKARWSYIRKDEEAEIDILIIIVLGQNYKLKEFYEVNWFDAFPLIREHKDGPKIFWDDLDEYKIALDKLPSNLLELMK